MTNENEIKTSNVEQDGNSDISNDDKPLSLYEKTINERKKVETVLAELKAENERRERLMSEELLGGDTGGNQKPQPPKEDTPTEYVDKIMNGEFNEKED